ncbi:MULTISPECIES: DUF1648 domain-containing protein [unclassified Luteococcus]|uniref:DUF1648 domain-containing protein n=1 Tax=unclassified Luteococcus TaxID=2639923 RepID=UPI00313CE811
MNTTTTTQEFVDHPPARVYWLPALVCLLCTAGGVVLVWSVRGQLPDPVVAHWGADGRPDGFTPLSQVVSLHAILTPALSLPMLAVGAAMKQARVMAPVVAGTATFVATTFFGGIWMQRGRPTGQAGDEWSSVAAGVVAAIAVGGLVWLATRAPKVLVPASTVLPDGVPTVTGPTNGRFAWTGSLVRGRAVHWFFGLAALPVVAMGVLFAVLGNLPGALFMLLTLLVVLVPFQMMFARITVDSRGLRTAGPIRWVNIPLETIVSAEVGRTVNPLGDFGGYGLRGALFDGARGLVTAEAPTLLVHQAGKPPMYLTVADPETAAATLNTLLATQRRGR